METIFGMIECFLASRKIAMQKYGHPYASLNLECYLKVSMTTLLTNRTVSQILPDFLSAHLKFVSAAVS